MKPIKCPLLFSFCLIASCLNIGVYDEGKDFLDKNHFVTYGCYFNIGNTAIPFDINFTNDTWKVYSYFLNNSSDKHPDSIVVQTAQGTNSFPVYQTPSDSLIVRILKLKVFFYDPYLFLIYEADTNFNSYSCQIYRFNFQTDTASLIYSDSSSALKVIGRIDSLLYFDSISGTSCFNFRTYIFNNCTIAEDEFVETIIINNGEKYAAISGKIFKIAASADTIWKTDSLFSISGITLKNGYIYVCGTEGYYRQIGMDYSEGNYDPFVAKIDGNTGHVIWKNNYETGTLNDMDFLDKIVFDDFGNIVCLGSSGPWGVGLNQYLSFFNIDINGNLLKTFLLTNKADKASDIDLIIPKKILRINSSKIKLLFEARSYSGGVCNFYSEFNY